MVKDSRSREARLRRKISKLKEELSPVEKELRNIRGGFASGRARVDRVRDAEIAERYPLVKGCKNEVAALAREFEVPVHQLRRAAARHKRWLTTQPAADRPATPLPRPAPSPKPAPQVSEPDPLTVWCDELDRVTKGLIGDMAILQHALANPTLHDPKDWAKRVEARAKGMKEAMKLRPPKRPRWAT